MAPNTFHNIVIIGGGFAGIRVCNDIEKALTKANDTTHRIILVETKSHFYHSIGGPRASVMDIDDQILVPYTNLFKNKQQHRVIQATAVAFETYRVILDRSVPEFGTTLEFAYAVLATGTLYPVPCKASAADDSTTTHRTLAALRAKIQSANAILIVGAGPVGIELAGEISEHYPSKRITLVHNKDRAMDDVSAPPHFRAKLTALLQQQTNITIHWNESVMLSPSQLHDGYMEVSKVLTRSGKTIETELVLWACGNRPQTAWLKNTPLGIEMVNPRNGYIRVKPTFQVDHPNLPHVYVVGDAADLNETKLAYRVNDHAPVLVHNLVNAAVLTNKNKTTTTMTFYKKGPDAMLVTFGSKKGATLLPFFGGVVLGNKATALFKGKSLFIDSTWKSLHLSTRNQKETSFSYYYVTVFIFVIAVVIALILNHFDHITV